ncbi:MAG: ribose-phosphate diphosphokinase [Bacteroidota bacterium]
MNKLLFNTQSYQYLADELIASGTFEEGVMERSYFSDGELYQRIQSKVNRRHVVLIGGTTDEATTLELFDLACGLVAYGAESLSLVVPYFGYSTMERAVKSREVVIAKTRARLLSAIPQSHRGNRIYLFDLHTEGIPHYFEQNLQPMHVYCKELVIQAAKDLGGTDFVLASTDAGRAKWVESLANDIGVNAAFVLKRRLSGDQTEVSAVNADVTDKTVVIYDDLIRSGGSIIQAAKTYKEVGAKDIYVITTHGLFINNGLQKLKDCGLIRKVICTNTHANVSSIKDDFLEVRSVAGLISKVVK